MEKFIESVADDAVSKRETERPQIEKNYLKTVRWCQGVKKTGAGGLIVIVGSGGSMEFVALEDLMELSMSYGQWMAYRQNMEINREKVMGIELQTPTLEMRKDYVR